MILSTMINTENNHQNCFIAVHAGAGYHAPDNAEKYLTACRTACIAAMQCLKSGFSALDAVTMAVKSLEDSPCTNAGLGSNLTLDGSVECDAGVMDGKSLVFGAVGSISGVKNPIEVAHKLVLMQEKEVLSLGRIPPSILVGEGARHWAYRNGFQCVANDSLITDTSKRTYNKYKRKLDNIESCILNKKSKTTADDINKDIFSSDILQKKLCPVSKDVPKLCDDKSIFNVASSKQTSFFTPSDGCDVESNVDVSSRLLSQESNDLQYSINLGLQRTNSLQDTHTLCSRSKPQVTDVQDTITVGSQKNIGLKVTNSSCTKPQVTDVQDTISVGSQKSIGLKVTNSSCTKPQVTDVQDTISVGSQKSIGLRVTKSSCTKPQVTDVQDTISVGSQKSIGLKVTNSSCTKPQVTDVQDTVGAVCVDHAGNMAAAGSSGGIWLKQMGRLGPAAVFGAGCWAHNGMKNKTPGIAVATTGCGEQLMKTLLAKQCGDALQKGDDGNLTFSSVLKDCFINSEFLQGVQDKNAGMLGLVYECGTSGNQDNSSDSGVCSVEVLWGHTTSSMCLGYMSEVHHKARTLISRLPTDSKPGTSLAIQGKLFML